MRGTLIIGSRRSKLAIAQTHMIKRVLERADPDCTISVKEIVTSGDQFLGDLKEKGGKGLFVKEIEDALINGDIDLAVHSVKDLPAMLPDQLTLSAIPKRESPFDVFISKSFQTISEMVEGAKLGTSSARRSLQALRLNPLVQIVPLRGNVDTRLQKLEEGEVDGIILAESGLNRLGLKLPFASSLSDVMVPAVGQGALGIETRLDDEELIDFLRRHSHDLFTEAEVLAERAFMRSLQADCHTPIGAHALHAETTLTMRGWLASWNGERVIQEIISGPSKSPESLGHQLAERFLSKGGAEMLKR